MRRLAGAFKSSFRVSALSVAISRNGQFVFDQGFGFNQGFQTGTVKDPRPTNMSSLFRIAELTMPITSVAIFSNKLLSKSKPKTSLPKVEA